MTAPISTTNITGLRNWWRGSSLRSESSTARSHDRAVEERAGLVAEGLVGHRRRFLVECDVELEHVDARLAEEAEEAAVGVVVDQVQDPLAGAEPRTAATRWAWMRALASEMWGSTPEAEVVTASTGTSAAVRPGS